MAVFLELVAAVRHFQRKRREIGSTPAEGSSKKATFGLPIIVMATHIFRLLPPLKTPACTSMYSCKDNSSEQKSIVESMRFAGMPFTIAKYCRCSFKVSFSQRGLYWGQTPTCSKICMIPLLTSSPNSLTLPVDFGTAAVMMLKEVDLPAPFGPSSPKISPSPTEKLLFLMAVFPLPYTFVRCSILMGALTKLLRSGLSSKTWLSCRSSSMCSLALTSSEKRMFSRKRTAAMQKMA